MGLILDTSILIASERRRESVEQLLERIESVHGAIQTTLSVISVVELTHGIFRAKKDSDRDRRREYAAEIYRDLTVYPVTLEIAQLAGRIEGEQAAVGNIIAFADLLIGATSLHLGFDVATINVKHFERIPGLKVVTL